MKIIIDFPLVVTSIYHNWFKRSANSTFKQNKKFSAFYYWKTNVKKSDYIAEYNHSTLYYLHLKNRPDLPILNWNFPLVSKAIKVCF